MVASGKGSSLNPLGASHRNHWLVSREEVVTIREPRPARPLSFTDRQRRVTIDLAKSAIVVVDMQNDFCHPQGWLAHIGVDVAPAREPIAPLQALLPRLRLHDVPVIWLNWGNRPDRMNIPPAVLHVYNSDGQSVGLGDPLPATGAKVLEAGSWSAAVVDELAPLPGDIAISKFRMSGFQDTELDSILRNLDVDTVLFAGVNLDQCVLCTLQDANFRGYDCVLLEDCSATTSPQFCTDATLYNVRQCFGFVANSTEFLSALGDAS